ncbi:hypothetical protein [Neptunomonas japonica]|uniref:hypothetical protein n=1 Tax=Neptunomonas japonica TaxID=417574 RepID=UPI00048FCD68|nr:hypothetical protein [Neptunomonas japonica]
MFTRFRGQTLAVVSALLLSATNFSHAETQTEASSKSNERSNTELSNIKNLIPVLDAYYGELNKQLDRHLRNRKQGPNSPFAKLPEAQKPSNLQFKPSNQQKENARYSLLSQDNPRQLPSMNFRGLMQAKGKKMALLEVMGLGTFVVKEGDKVGLQQVGSSGAVLHILEINELNLIVETGSYGQQMVVQ